MQRGAEQLKEADGSAEREGEPTEAAGSKGEMRHRRGAGKKTEGRSGGGRRMLAKDAVGEVSRYAHTPTHPHNTHAQNEHPCLSKLYPRRAKTADAHVNYFWCS